MSLDVPLISHMPASCLALPWQELRTGHSMACNEPSVVSSATALPLIYAPQRASTVQDLIACIHAVLTWCAGPLLERALWRGEELPTLGSKLDGIAWDARRGLVQAFCRVRGRVQGARYQFREVRSYRFGMALVPLTQVQWRLRRRHAGAQMPG